MLKYHFRETNLLGCKNSKSILWATNSACSNRILCFLWSFAFKHNDANSILLRKSIESNKIQSSGDWLFSLRKINYINCMHTNNTFTPAVVSYHFISVRRSAKALKYTAAYCTIIMFAIRSSKFEVRTQWIHKVNCIECHEHQYKLIAFKGAMVKAIFWYSTILTFNYYSKHLF